MNQTLFQLDIVRYVSMSLKDGTVIDDDDDECFQLIPDQTLIKFTKKGCHQPVKPGQLTICLQDGKMSLGDPIEVVIYDLRLLN